MSTDRLRRLAAIEARRPLQRRRVAIVVGDAVAPADATFVVRLVAAEFPETCDGF